MAIFNIFGKGNSDKEKIEAFMNLKDTNNDTEFITNSTVGGGMRMDNLIVTLGPVITMPVETDDNRIKFTYNNALPQYLNQLYKKVPLHSRIIKHIKDEVINDYSFEYDKNVENDIALQKFLNKTIKKNYDLDDFNDWLEDLLVDYIVQGNCFIEETRKNNKTISIEHKPAERYRICGDKNTLNYDGFAYNVDWLNGSNYVKLNKYNKDLGEGKHVLYIPNRQPYIKFYGEPDYISAKEWLELAVNISDLYKQHISNGVYPSAIATFYEYPTEPERLNSFKETLMQLGGANSRGKILTLLGKTPELAAKIEKMELNDMDNVFIQVQDAIQREICYAYGIAPIVMGLKTPGSLGGGNSDEAEYFTEQFEKRLKNYKKTIVKIIQTLLNNAGLTQIKFKIK